MPPKNVTFLTVQNSRIFTLVETTTIHLPNRAYTLRYTTKSNFWNGLWVGKMFMLSINKQTMVQFKGFFRVYSIKTGAALTLKIGIGKPLESESIIIDQLTSSNKIQAVLVNQCHFNQ